MNYLRASKVALSDTPVESLALKKFFHPVPSPSRLSSNRLTSFTFSSVSALFTGPESAEIRSKK